MPICHLELCCGQAASHGNSHSVLTGTESSDPDIDGSNSLMPLRQMQPLNMETNWVNQASEIPQFPLRQFPVKSNKQCIFVMMGGPTRAIETPMSTKIVQLKQILRDRFGRDINLGLTWGGHWLKDQATLSDYGITANATIIGMGGLPGGSGAPGMQASRPATNSARPWHGLKGLHNIERKTCFMNTCFQLMGHSPRLLDAMMRDRAKVDNQSIMARFCDLWLQPEITQTEIQSLIDAIATKKPYYAGHSWGRGEQDDDYDFLMTFVDILLEELGEDSTLLCSETQESEGPCDGETEKQLLAQCQTLCENTNSSIVMELMSLRKITKSSLELCQNSAKMLVWTRVEFDHRMEIALDDSHTVTLDNLLRRQIKTNEETTRCHCGLVHPITRTESIVTLPNVLAIHLSRSRVRQIPDGEAGKRPFRHNGKIRTQVTAPATSSELLPQLGTFRPTGKSAHSGFSFDHGHFEARIPKADRWFRISDRHISELDRGPSDNADSQTTILMFEKHQPDGSPYQGERHPQREPRPQPAAASAEEDAKRPKPPRPAEPAAPRPPGNYDEAPRRMATPKAEIPRKQRAQTARELPSEVKHWKVLQQNVGGAFNAKGLILTQSAEKFDIICAQEVGEIGEVPSQQPFPGYVTFVASTGHAHNAGVAILIKQELACFVQGEPYRDAGGRLICITLKGFSKAHQQTLMIASVYMPSGLDTVGTRTPEHAVAKHLHQLIRDKATQHDLAIVAGDFNET